MRGIGVVCIGVKAEKSRKHRRGNFDTRSKKFGRREREKKVARNNITKNDSKICHSHLVGMDACYFGC